MKFHYKLNYIAQLHCKSAFDLDDIQVDNVHNEQSIIKDVEIERKKEREGGENMNSPSQ